MAGSSKKKSKSASSRRTVGNPAKRPVVEAGPVRLRDWIGAARPRTLALAIAPVVIGTGAAQITEHAFHWLLALGCLAVAVLLQIGVNFANDYSDGIRGADAQREGPARLTASGRVKPRRVLMVALFFFLLAAAAGVAIVVRTQEWWLLGVGAACLLAAWFYTGGKRPYGYYALGEVFVFLFFGLVATLGTAWVQARYLADEAWIGGVIAGLLACAVLLTNNLRDRDHDRAVGKKTLSVLIGRTGSRVLFTVLIALAFLGVGLVGIFYPAAWLALFALLAALPAVLIVWTYRLPRELVVALSLTSLTALLVAGGLYWAYAG